MQSDGVVGFENWSFTLGEDRSGIKPDVHEHDGDAGFLIAFEQCPLYWCGTAMSRQEGRVDVHTAVGWYREQCRRQYLAVGSHHDHVRFCRLNCADEGKVAAFLRLPYGQAGPCCQLFHRRRLGFELSALRTIRLRDDTDDTER